MILLTVGKCVRALETLRFTRDILRFLSSHLRSDYGGEVADPWVGDQRLMVGDQRLIFSSVFRKMGA